ncbi:AfsR/SARP family transcriptional regulator [Flindersiella endophytica]
MEFRLFGQMELWAGGQPLDLGTPRQQAVLAALLVDAPRPVGIETLVDRVWDDSPPVEARSVLYSYLSRIRQLLKRAATHTGETTVFVERRPAGYVLDIDPERVDLHRFARLVEHGRDPQRTDADRADALTEALGLWRGPPLAGIQGGWVTQVRSSCHRLRLDAAMQWAQVKLRLGRPTAVVAMLPDLIVEYPLVEPLEDLLMRALHATGRDAEAIDRYTAIRQRLADELGTDPGFELRALHQAILRGELPPPAQADQPTVARVLASPAQLPPDVYGFSGRENELDRLDGLLTAGGHQPTAVVISAVSGTAGVGKTALAVHWAHRVRDEFTDGQLYVNLRGFDPAGPPVTPAEAVRGFLDAFEVPPQRIPAAFEAQIALYRSLLADRKVLIVLDNARDAEQARPLLPGAAGSLVVVTSRNQLTGLVATAGAQPMALDLLTTAESRELLSSRLGHDRVTAEPLAADDIIATCVRLPLALAIVAARAATHPSFPLATLAAELRNARSLNAFASTDPATDVRAVFSWSYRQLSTRAARLFRLLGLHPGPDISAPAEASLAGIPFSETQPLLVELTRAHLITEHMPGRYTFHDLLRAYATELVHGSGTERNPAVHRMLDHYLHSANAAALLLNPHYDPITMPPARPGVTPEDPPGYQQAVSWFTTERPVLLAILNLAANAGFDIHTWQLAWTMSGFLDRRGHWHDWEATQAAAVEAARRLGDRAAQARALRGLASASTRFGRYDDACDDLRRALDIHHELGDRIGQAHAHFAFSWALGTQGRHADALRHAERALDLYRETGHRPGQAGALNAVGWAHALLGNDRQALTYSEQALTLSQDLGDQDREAGIWDTLGSAHNHLGHHRQAIICYRHAIDLYRSLADRYHEAVLLSYLGDTQCAAGDPHAARATWQHALAILEELHNPTADDVRIKLRQLDPHSPDTESKRS